MSYSQSALRAAPPRQRILLALLLLPVGLVLLVAGALVGWRAGSLLGHLGGAVIAVLALVLLGIAHGMFYSARRDESERALDSAVLAAAPGCDNDCDSCTSDCAVKALPRH